ncbi:hypothetical protein BE221DRAFT_49515, partial [Ostreococcus tauri]
MTVTLRASSSFAGAKSDDDATVARVHEPSSRGERRSTRVILLIRHQRWPAARSVHE